jgi:hypothetical protein
MTVMHSVDGGQTFHELPRARRLPLCGAEEPGNTGYKCERDAGHAGDHADILDAHDELGPIPPRTWPNQPKPSSTEMYAAHRELVDLIRVDHIKHGAGCPQHQGGACDCSARRVRELVDLLRRGHGPAQT